MCTKFNSEFNSIIILDSIVFLWTERVLGALLHNSPYWIHTITLPRKPVDCLSVLAIQEIILSYVVLRQRNIRDVRGTSSAGCETRWRINMHRDDTLTCFHHVFTYPVQRRVRVYTGISKLLHKFSFRNFSNNFEKSVYPWICEYSWI